MHAMAEGNAFEEHVQYMDDKAGLVVKEVVELVAEQNGKKLVDLLEQHTLVAAGGQKG